MTDEPERVGVTFEHRAGWDSGAVSLPTGLRDKAEIVDGTFTVDFSPTESLVSNRTFVSLIDAGHVPLNDSVPDEYAERVQRTLEDADAGGSASSEPDGDSDNAADADGDVPEDSLDAMSRSELYEYAHKLDAVPDDDIPSWNASDADGLRELIRHHVDEAFTE